MKKFFYALYAFIFNICRVFPVRDNRVALVAPHRSGDGDSLGAISRALEADGGYDIRCITTTDLTAKHLFKALGFFTQKAYLLATSHYVFLNDNFMPMASMRFSKKAVIAQLWHAEGAFKKFGLSLDLPEDIRKREAQGCKKLTCVICSSKGVAPIYAEAFGVSKDKVLPLGSPRTDMFFAPYDRENARAHFDSLYPECAGKKLILYAPTFRDSAEADSKITEAFDFERFNAELGNEFALLVRLHPQIHSSPIPGNATDVTGYADTGMLVMLTDMLITDYSSICMDFALLNKKCVFYAFDLEEYTAQRSFYFDYLSYIPGEAVQSFDALIEAIKSPEAGKASLDRFREFNFDTPDGNATARVIDTLMKASS